MITNPRIIKLATAYPNLEPAQAKLVLFLYDQGGFASHSDIAQHLGRPINGVGEWRKALNLIKIMVCNIRKSIGKYLIVAVWGRGYELTPNAKLLAALSDE